jgi:catechol 2,3-dioxygenase-like lactoylglutathione lyase family enzyme
MGHARDYAPPMLDHVTVYVSDYPAAIAFYAQALAPLGLVLRFEPMRGLGGFAGEQRPGQGSFPLWVADGDEPTIAHLAFTAKDRATVDAFHVAALAAGGTDNGPPGLREIYHPNYYAAYVLSPDGVNLEAVCHLPA